MEQKYPVVLPDFHLSDIHVKLLKHAKRRIKNGFNEHVCNAIQNGVHSPIQAGLECNREDRSTASLELRNFIRRAIEGKVYFDTWQQSHGLERTREKIRKDRIKWIKYILENANRR